MVDNIYLCSSLQSSHFQKFDMIICDTFRIYPVELRSFRTLLPVFFRQPHHLVNSSAETHGNSTTSTSTFPTSSPTKKNIHQPCHPSSMVFLSPSPTPNHNNKFQIIPKSNRQLPNVSVFALASALLLLSTMPPSFALRSAMATLKATEAPEARRWVSSHEGDDQLGLMGSDLEPKGWFYIYEMRNMCLKPIFLMFFSLWFYFGAPLILTKITMIGTEV